MLHNDLKDSRFEFKYRVRYQDYLRIKNSIRRYMKEDDFTKKSNDVGYLVRSLYFDTYDYQAYQEKMSGDNQRTKIRIRSYDRCLNENTVLRVELKHRDRNLVIKRSTFVNDIKLNNFEKNNLWEYQNDAVLEEFNRLLRGRSFEPKVLIEYYREGFRTPIKEDVRITFDHQVKSSESKKLFPDKSHFRIHHYNDIIMEVKFKEQLPLWLKPIIHQHGLTIIANSKFTQAIQLSRKDLIHPSGVIYVR